MFSAMFMHKLVKHKISSSKFDKLQIYSSTSLSSPSKKTIKKNSTDHRGAKGI